MTPETLKSIVEGALFAAGRALTIEQLQALFEEPVRPDAGSLRAVLSTIAVEHEDRAVQLQQVASGWRFQVRADVAPWVSRLWDERPQRYSRALLETLSLIAYKQPITRSEIEDIRGVTVSTQIVKTLLEREWIRVAGHKEVPGRPALFATTRQFLDDFNLKSLAELPALADIRDLSEIAAELETASHE